MDDLTLEGSFENEYVLIKEEIFSKGQDFIENALDIILVIDKCGKIIYGNKKAIEVYGYSFNELINLDIFDIRKEDAKEFIQEQLSIAFDKGIKFKTYHYRKDGSKFPVEVISIYSNNNHKDIVLSIIKDISDIEEEYKDANIFSGVVEYYKYVTDKNSIENDLQEKYRQLEMLKQKAEDNNKPFNLKETINNVYNNLLVLGNSKGLEVSYFLDSSIDFEIIGDELRVKEILNNLINNAVKFTDEGYISFRIKKISDSDTIEKIEFRIKDSGVGIEETFKEKIFNEFTQGELSTTKNHIGTGLVLAISKQFANLMGGDICFESSAGRGSTFIFTCQFEKSKKKKQNYEINTIPNEKITINNLEQDIVILCVEDNLINQEIMERLIKRKGYKYIAAYNGNEALDTLKNTKIDLILMDIQMPELNGFETTKIIREENFSSKHIPIIAMTAYATREDKDKCLQADMDDYIVKPFDIEKLYEIIESHLLLNDE